MTKRTYETDLVNQCADLAGRAKIGDDVERVSFRVEDDQGRHASFSMSWCYLSAGASPHLDAFGDAWWAFPLVADVMGHLAAASRVRKEPTPDDFRLVLEGCGFVEESTRKPTFYVGHDDPRPFK